VHQVGDQPMYQNML